MGWLKSEIKGRNIERRLGMKWSRLRDAILQWKKIRVTNQRVLFWDWVHFLRSLFIKEDRGSFWVSRVSHNSFQPWRSSKEAWPVLSCDFAESGSNLLNTFKGFSASQFKTFPGICLFAYVSSWFYKDFVILSLFRDQLYGQFFFFKSLIDYYLFAITTHF